MKRAGNRGNARLRLAGRWFELSSDESESSHLLLLLLLLFSTCSSVLSTARAAIAAGTCISKKVDGSLETVQDPSRGGLGGGDAVDFLSAATPRLSTGWGIVLTNKRSTASRVEPSREFSLVDFFICDADGRGSLNFWRWNVGSLISRRRRWSSPLKFPSELSIFTLSIRREAETTGEIRSGRTEPLEPRAYTRTLLESINKPPPPFGGIRFAPASRWPDAAAPREFDDRLVCPAVHRTQSIIFTLTRN